MSKTIRLMLSCGQVEEGVLENWDELDVTDMSHWVVISIRGNPNKKLRINKKYIAAHQIEEIVDKAPIQVEQFVEKETVKKKMPFNTNLITRAKVVAEKELAHDHDRKREVSQEYAENVYSDPSIMIKRI